MSELSKFVQDVSATEIAALVGASLLGAVCSRMLPDWFQDFLKGHRERLGRKRELLVELELPCNVLLKVVKSLEHNGHPDDFEHAATQLANFMCSTAASDAIAEIVRLSPRAEQRRIKELATKLNGAPMALKEMFTERRGNVDEDQVSGVWDDVIEIHDLVTQEIIKHDRVGAWLAWPLRTLSVVAFATVAWLGDSVYRDSSGIDSGLTGFAASVAAAVVAGAVHGGLLLADRYLLGARGRTFPVWPLSTLLWWSISLIFCYGTVYYSLSAVFVDGSPHSLDTLYLGPIGVVGCGTLALRGRTKKYGMRYTSERQLKKFKRRLTSPLRWAQRKISSEDQAG